VEELVDETIRALVATITTPSTNIVNEVGGARWQLRTLIMRVRKQIDQQEVPELAPSVLRSSARSMGRAARWLIPRVVAATVGAVVEAHAPGSGLGLLAWPSLTRTTEDISELATNMVIGNPSPAPEVVQPYEPLWTWSDPIHVHTAALLDQLHGLDSPAGHKVPAEYRSQIASEMIRHLNRLEELACDNGWETASITQQIERLRYFLDALRHATLPPGERSASTLYIREIIVELQGELIQAGAAQGEGSG
jgi:hypothetical protein